MCFVTLYPGSDMRWLMTEAGVEVSRYQHRVSLWYRVGPCTDGRPDLVPPGKQRSSMGVARSTISDYGLGSIRPGILVNTQGIDRRVRTDSHVERAPGNNFCKTDLRRLCNGSVYHYHNTTLSRTRTRVDVGPPFVTVFSAFRPVAFLKKNQMDGFKPIRVDPLHELRISLRMHPATVPGKGLEMLGLKCRFRSSVGSVPTYILKGETSGVMLTSPIHRGAISQDPKLSSAKGTLSGCGEANRLLAMGIQLHTH